MILNYNMPLHVYRPAEEKSDPSSPSTGKAPPRPLVKGEGPREGLDRFSSYDYQGKGKLTKKELRRAVNKRIIHHHHYLRSSLL